MTPGSEDEAIRQRLREQLLAGASVSQLLRSEIDGVFRQDRSFDNPPQVAPFTPIYDPGLDYVQTPFGWCRRGSERQADVATAFIIVAIVVGFILAFVAFGMRS